MKVPYNHFPKLGYQAPQLDHFNCQWPQASTKRGPLSQLSYTLHNMSNHALREDSSACVNDCNAADLADDRARSPQKAYDINSYIDIMEIDPVDDTPNGRCDSAYGISAEPLDFSMQRNRYGYPSDTATFSGDYSTPGEHYYYEQPLDLTTNKFRNFQIHDEDSSQTHLSDESAGPADDTSSESENQSVWLEKIKTGTRSRVRSPKSWEFLLRLLLDSNSNPSMIRWEDEKTGTFRLVMKDEIARIWGGRSAKHKKDGITYDNFARNLRYHYKTEMMVPVSEKHLVYRFGSKIMEKIRAGELQV